MNNIKSINGKISKLIRQYRTNQNLSLREIIKFKFSENKEMSLSPSALINYEKKGLPLGTLKILYLLYHYKIDIKDIFENQNTEQTMKSIQMKELYSNINFIKLCEVLISKKKNVSNGLILAYINFIKSIEKNKED